MSIGHTGRFEGNIKAHRLLVSGYVEGVIDCASLEIVAEGRVFGELHSDDFIIEAGGQFLGESHPRREVPLAALQHEGAAESQLSAPETEQDAGQIPPPTEPEPEPDPEPPRPEPQPEPPSAARPPEELAQDEAAAKEPGEAPETEQEEEEQPRNVRPQPRQTFWGRR